MKTRPHRPTLSHTFSHLPTPSHTPGITPLAARPSSHLCEGRGVVRVDVQHRHQLLWYRGRPPVIEGDVGPHHRDHHLGPCAVGQGRRAHAYTHSGEGRRDRGHPPIRNKDRKPPVSSSPGVAGIAGLHLARVRILAVLQPRPAAPSCGLYRQPSNPAPQCRTSRAGLPTTPSRTWRRRRCSRGTGTRPAPAERSWCAPLRRTRPYMHERSTWGCCSSVVPRGRSAVGSRRLLA